MRWTRTGVRREAEAVVRPVKGAVAGAGAGAGDATGQDLARWEHSCLRVHPASLIRIARTSDASFFYARRRPAATMG